MGKPVEKVIKTHTNKDGRELSITKYEYDEPSKDFYVSGFRDEDTKEIYGTINRYLEDAEKEFEVRKTMS